MLCGCVCLCVRVSIVPLQAASCQWGGVKRPEGFEHSRPAKLTVCLDNGMFPPLSPSLHPPPSLPLLKISADSKAPPTPPPLLSAYMSILSLSLSPSASIGHYLTSSILSIEENPPTSPPAEQPHCHQSASILL